MTSSSGDSEASQSTPDPILKRHVTAAVIGNALEFYDFTTYAFFATQISQAFFPGKTSFTKLILALIAFGVGFALRPLGAIVIGRLADRAGRKPAMLLSLTIMGVSIIGLALTPTYAAIGMAAPILVLGWRLIQGFALGAEVGPTTAFLVESAPPGQRGLFGAWQSVSQNLAAIAGGLVGVSIAGLAGSAFLASWGWRIAFLIGAIILPFGYYLRRSLPESLHRSEAPSPVHPQRPHLAGHWRVLLIGLALITAATVSTYIFNYLTTYAIHTLGMPPAAALGATLINGVAGVIGGLAGGILCDRYGRKPLLIWPRIAFLIATWPAFLLMVRRHDPQTLMAATFVIAFLSALSTAAVLVGLTESLDKSVRGLAMGTVYATAVCIFGGATQPFVAWLTHATGDPLSPAWVTIASGLVGLVASLFYRESAPARLAPYSMR